MAIILLIMIFLVLGIVISPIVFLSYATYASYKQKKRTRAGLCVSIGVLYLAFCIYLFLPRSASQVASGLLGFTFSRSDSVLEFSGEDFYLPIPGGMSDGEVYVVLQLSERQHQRFLEYMKTDESWFPLPLPEDFFEHSRLLEPSVIGGYVSKHKIPFSGQDGFYRFVDYQARHNTMKRRVYDTDKPFYQRFSYNFLFALYDRTTFRLHVYELHT